MMLLFAKFAREGVGRREIPFFVRDFFLSLVQFSDLVFRFHRHLSLLALVFDANGLGPNDQLAGAFEEVYASEGMGRLRVRDEGRSIKAHRFRRTREETDKLSGVAAQQVARSAHAAEKKYPIHSAVDRDRGKNARHAPD
jgi:hypothetical protein